MYRGPATITRTSDHEHPREYHPSPALIAAAKYYDTVVQAKQLPVIHSRTTPPSPSPLKLLPILTPFVEGTTESPLNA
jgi:hypothetical protein